MDYNFAELPAAWQGFLQACQSCRACELYKSRTEVVVFRGALEAPLMIIGEGPGREEDRLGKPFVGRSGRLLDDALAALEFSEADYHIANTVKCRPPQNRTPSEEEAKACRRLLNAQFVLVRPRLILLCGATAYRNFFGESSSISKIRGQWIEKGGLLFMPTFHPAYILRNMRMRGALWEDLLKLRRKMEELQLISPMRHPVDAYLPGE